MICYNARMSALENLHSKTPEELAEIVRQYCERAAYAHRERCRTRARDRRRRPHRQRETLRGVGRNAVRRAECDREGPGLARRSAERTGSVVVIYKHHAVR